MKFMNIVNSVSLFNPKLCMGWVTQGCLHSSQNCAIIWHRANALLLWQLTCCVQQLHLM